MNQVLLKAYHRLPYQARCTAAGIFGAYLNRWRYDAKTERLVEEALEREQWTEAQWSAWREDRLALLLHRAATAVPYYRDAWRTRRLQGDRRSWDVLENWPILEKEDLRRTPERFVADDCDRGRMFVEHTSGTTGTPIVLWRSRETVRQWYALHEARCRSWYGITRQDRWAIVGGRQVVSPGQRKPPFWVWNPALKQLYLSAFHVAPARGQDYLDAMRRYRIEYILGYSASIATLAGEALRSGRKLSLKVVITNAEPLTPAQRSVIEQAFQCPVRETYGLAEIVAAASECQCGNLHEWPETGISEIRPDGELIATGLMNADMPLIRYRTGDRRTAPPRGAACGCDRRLPLYGTIEGRLDDVLYLRDGRQIGRMDPVFKAELPIREAQIIQETLDCLRVRFVPAENFTDGSGDEIVRCIRNSLGPIQIVLEPMESIPREANGKFRAVICRLPRDRQQSALQAAGGAR
jgi:phenylacetate-CoA ligase